MNAYDADVIGNTPPPANGIISPVIMDTAAYDVWGGLLADIDANTGAAETWQDPVGWGGQFGYYLDRDAGYYLLGHRYYDPYRGRFLTRDPSGYAAGPNLYTFAGGDPINESDPSGLDKNDPDQCGLPDDGDLGTRTAHPGMHAGTAQSNTARAMTRSLTSTLVMAGLGIVTGFGGSAEEEAVSLSAKQRGILGQLARSGSQTLMHKRAVAMSDLRNLTIHTGDEFAMFTRGSQRMIMRGVNGAIPTSMMNVECATAMAKAGWRFSGHTHTRGFAPVGSVGDEAILRAFGQSRSGIWSTSGNVGTFYRDFFSRLTHR